jgi:hypothetical protein
MKTTLNIDDDVLLSAKRQAAATDRTLTSMVETALRQLLAVEQRATKPYRFRGKPVKGKLLPGVDLNDRDGLYDLMERRD